MNPLRLTAPALAVLSLWAPVAGAGVPGGVASPGETLVATFHAEDAQIYECKADTAGKLVWKFREPIATLVMDGRTVGRHFAGPSWQFDDGGAVTARVVERAAGATSADIPLLTLAASPQRDGGLVAGVTTILRLATKGGVKEGPCQTAGALYSAPYAADYAFYRGTRSSQRH